MSLINIKDHTMVPGGRHYTDGPDSGQWFRERVLIPHLRQASIAQNDVIVTLDGVGGYGSSFLEEAFGGLVRSGEFSVNALREHLMVVALTRLYKPYEMLASRYLDAAFRAAAARAPAAARFGSRRCSTC